VSKLIVQEFLTLDGVMQAPGPNDDDREGGFTYGGWLAPYFDDPLWHTIGQLHAKPVGCCLAARPTRPWPATGRTSPMPTTPWRRP
jgi:hypothetical protein